MLVALHMQMCNMANGNIRMHRTFNGTDRPVKLSGEHRQAASCLDYHWSCVATSLRELL